MEESSTTTACAGAGACRAPGRAASCALAWPAAAAFSSGEASGLNALSSAAECGITHVHCRAFSFVFLQEAGHKALLILRHTARICKRRICGAHTGQAQWGQEDERGMRNNATNSQTPKIPNQPISSSPVSRLLRPLASYQQGRRLEITQSADPGGVLALGKSSILAA